MNAYHTHFLYISSTSGATAITALQHSAFSRSSLPWSLFYFVVDGLNKGIPFGAFFFLLLIVLLIHSLQVPRHSTSHVRRPTHILAHDLCTCYHPAHRTHTCTRTSAHPCPHTLRTCILEPAQWCTHDSVPPHDCTRTCTPAPTRRRTRALPPTCTPLPTHTPLSTRTPLSIRAQPCASARPHLRTTAPAQQRTHTTACPCTHICTPLHARRHAHALTPAHVCTPCTGTRPLTMAHNCTTTCMHDRHDCAPPHPHLCTCTMTSA